jgi:hypothetical protein
MPSNGSRKNVARLIMSAMGVRRERRHTHCGHSIRLSTLPAWARLTMSRVPTVLVINLRAAHKIGLSPPGAQFAQANEVIE